MVTVLAERELNTLNLSSGAELRASKAENLSDPDWAVNGVLPNISKPGAAELKGSLVSLLKGVLLIFTGAFEGAGTNGALPNKSVGLD